MYKRRKLSYTVLAAMNTEYIKTENPTAGPVQVRDLQKIVNKHTNL